ncbi:MAG: hypothetical protein RLY87_1601 [Chloroflexota bacterium]
MGGRTPDLNTASVALYQLSYCPRLYELGGGEEARTPGLDSAIVALYQLSYTPKTLFEVYDARTSFVKPSFEGRKKQNTPLTERSATRERVCGAIP